MVTFWNSHVALEEWRAQLRSIGGIYNPTEPSPDRFIGWVKPNILCGLDAADIGFNMRRVDRTYADIRRDGRERYYAVVQLGGMSVIEHNDLIAELRVGDIALIDSAKPIAYRREGLGQFMCICLPREKLRSRMGREPRAGLWKPSDMFPSRMLMQIVKEAIRGTDLHDASTEPFMQMVIYDLLSALFAAPDPSFLSSSAEKLFDRACAVMRGRFAETELTIGAIAAEVGIRPRYLQKLFTAKGLTCRNYILSLRLEHAAQLLQRRSRLQTGQSIGEVAFACGFNDYTYFSRVFRRRFGVVPSAMGKQ
jgi:AraC family transcriptional regulator, positive regulator of tynA and feaB